MRLSEDQPLHPDVLAELEAIDATLRGEPVDPVHAELAELALLVAAERPRMPAQATEALDAKIARRFVPLSAGPQAGGSEGALAAGRSGTGGGRGSSPRSRTSRVGTWMRRPAFGIGVAALATCAVAGAVVLHSTSSGLRAGSLAGTPYAGFHGGPTSSTVTTAASSSSAIPAAAGSGAASVTGGSEGAANQGAASNAGVKGPAASNGGATGIGSTSDGSVGAQQSPAPAPAAPASAVADPPPRTAARRSSPRSCS